MPAIPRSCPSVKVRWTGAMWTFLSKINQNFLSQMNRFQLKYISSIQTFLEFWTIEGKNTPLPLLYCYPLVLTHKQFSDILLLDRCKNKGKKNPQLISKLNMWTFRIECKSTAVQWRFGGSRGSLLMLRSFHLGKILNIG